jgi:hypothetical protein
MFRDAEDVNDFSLASYTQEVGVNVSDTFVYLSTGEDAEYWRLFTERNGLYYGVGNVHAHLIRSGGIVDNSISWAFTDMEIEPGNPEGRNGQLVFYHIFLGADVRIVVNNAVIEQVGGRQTGTVFYMPVSEGLKNGTLVLNQNGTLVVLAYTDPLLVVTYAPGGGVPGGEGIADIIPSEYHIWVAVGILLGFILLPFIVVSSVFSKIKASRGVEIHVPATVYTISSTVSGVTGFVVTLYFGFLPWWTVFLLVFVLVMVAAIMYLMKKGASE